MIWVANVSLIQSRSDWHSSVFSEGADQNMFLQGNDQGDDQDMQVVEDGKTETRDGMMTSEGDDKTNNDFGSRILQPGTKKYDEHRQGVINGLKSNGNEAMRKLIADVEGNDKETCNDDGNKDESFVNPI